VNHTVFWFQESVLHLAACSWCVRVIGVLVEAGANIAAKDYEGATPLHHAATKELRTETAVALLKRGAGINAKDLRQSTPLHYAAAACRFFHNSTVCAVDVLVEAGADIEARDSDEATPLHYAAKDIRIEAARALLKHGADVNARESNGDTPLHNAAGRGGNRSATMVDLLLRSGADETIVDEDGKAAVDVVTKLPGDGYDYFGEYDYYFGEPKEDWWDDYDDSLLEDIERVRRLLENAPADRADRARLRIFLMLCRAHPDRMQQVRQRSSAHVRVARGTRGAANLSRVEGRRGDGAAGGGTAEGRPGLDWTGVDWVDVVARVVGLPEEEIFRAIVGYL